LPFLSQAKQTANAVSRQPKEFRPKFMKSGVKPSTGRLLGTKTGAEFRRFIPALEGGTSVGRFRGLSSPIRRLIKSIAGRLPAFLILEAAEVSEKAMRFREQKQKAAIPKT